LNGKMTEPIFDDQTGVVHFRGPLPPVPPGPIASAIKQVTYGSLNLLPPSANGARVRLSHDKGVELAVAHRSADGHWQVDLWVGKNWTKSTSVEWNATAQILW
jgi:hypothetical protein